MAAILRAYVLGLPHSQAGYNASMRYHLRTLLILLAVLPPALAGAWWIAGKVLAEKQTLPGVSWGSYDEIMHFPPDWPKRKRIPVR
jgi:hypothetical protein